MLQDLVQPQYQLSMDDISSPISTQVFEFGDQDLFPEALQNSEVSSSSNCCYEENSSYSTNLSFSSFPSDAGRISFSSNGNIEAPISNATTTTTTTTKYDNNSNTNNNINELSIIFDSQDENDQNDISASIDFSLSPTFPVPPLLTTQQDQLNFSLLEHQIPPTNAGNTFSSFSPDSVVPLGGPLLSSVFEDDCLAPMASYVPLDMPSSSCSFIDPTMEPSLLGNLHETLSSNDTQGIYGGSIYMGSEIQPQELEFQGDNGGIYSSNSLQRVYSSGEIQTLNNENHHLVNGVGHSNPLATEISTLEESTYKVGKLSVEERKEKIHRYLKKRNERNFSKKIKYACRKTLADSRPRVRGRFAKNDEFGEASRPNSRHHEDEEDEDVPVKEEDDMIDSSDIFAHISGVNSFKCSYPIQSWT